MRIYMVAHCIQFSISPACAGNLKPIRKLPLCDYATLPHQFGGALQKAVFVPQLDIRGYDHAVCAARGKELRRGTVMHCRPIW
jgi:hypothetical protein